MGTTGERRPFRFEPSAISTPNEHELVNVFTQNGSELFGSLFFLLGTAEDAVDALDEVWTRCWKSGQVNSIKNVRAWVFRNLYTVVREKSRLEWLRKHKSIDLSSITKRPDVVSLEDAVLSFLRDAVAGLPFEERAVYLLRQNGSLSYQQIAQTTGDTLAGVKSKMRAALAKIHTSFRKNEGSIREKVFEQNVGTSGET